MHVMLVIVLLILNIKEKTWRNLKRYYISILYVQFFNFLYYYLCKHFILWDYQSNYLTLRTIRGLHLFLIMPLLTLLFLTKLPQTITQQLFYLLRWVMASLIVEWFALKKFKAIYFAHGWRLRWSLLLYVLMYSFSYFVLRKPVITSALSAITSVLLMIIFKVPMRYDFFFGPILLLIRKWKVIQKDRSSFSFKKVLFSKIVALAFGP